MSGILWFVRCAQVVRQDLVFTIRGLARSPGLTLTIVLPLSLGRFA